MHFFSSLKIRVRWGPSVHITFFNGLKMKNKSGSKKIEKGSLMWFGWLKGQGFSLFFLYAAVKSKFECKYIKVGYKRDCNAVQLFGIQIPRIPILWPQCERLAMAGIVLLFYSWYLLSLSTELLQSPPLWKSSQFSPTQVYSWNHENAWSTFTCGFLVKALFSYFFHASSVIFNSVVLYILRQ
jgi:hypothetical protein